MSHPVIAVLGGGIAGLFAARELLRNGYEVILIEARNRLGGRVYPINIEGIELQLGAAYLHDTGDSENPNMLISELKVENGLQSLGQAVQLDSPEITIISEDEETFGFALKQMFEGCNIDRLSPVDRDEMEGSYEGGEDNFFLYDGYSDLLKDLEAELTRNGKCHILKNTVITEVLHNVESNNHFLRTKDGMEIVCGGVICALPIGVLQGGFLKFTPPLPELLDRINSGNARRFVIQFEENFVDQQCSHIIMHDEETNTAFRILNVDYYRKAKNPDIKESNCLVVTYVPLHEKKENLTPDAVMKKIKNCLKERYEQHEGVIESGMIIAECDWGADDYCRGGWSSFNETIIDEDAFNEWFRKINKYCESCNIHFAGEYMSKGGNGTVHGAALSGKQAAFELEKSLKERDMPLDLKQEELFFSWSKHMLEAERGRRYLESNPNAKPGYAPGTVVLYKPSL